MGINVTGWYDDQTIEATGTLQDRYGVSNANSTVFDSNTWKALDSARSSALEFHGFHDQWKANVISAKGRDFAADLLVNGAIFGLGKVVGEALLTKALPETNILTNPLPNNGVFASVMPKEFAKALADGKIKTLSGGPEAWVTAATDLKGITTVEGAAQRLTLVDASGNLRLGDSIVYFRLKNFSGVASPVYRTNPGYVYGGLTRGGAREWVIPSNSNIEIIKIVYLK